MRGNHFWIAFAGGERYNDTNFTRADRAGLLCGGNALMMTALLSNLLLHTVLVLVVLVVLEKNGVFGHARSRIFSSVSRCSG